MAREFPQGLEHPPSSFVSDPSSIVNSLQQLTHCFDLISDILIHGLLQIPQRLKTVMPGPTLDLNALRDCSYKGRAESHTNGEQRWLSPATRSA
jgi:hypothetical protein